MLNQVYIYYSKVNIIPLKEIELIIAQFGLFAKLDLETIMIDEKNLLDITNFTFKKKSIRNCCCIFFVTKSNLAIPLFEKLLILGEINTENNIIVNLDNSKIPHEFSNFIILDFSSPEFKKSLIDALNDIHSKNEKETKSFFSLETLSLREDILIQHSLSLDLHEDNLLSTKNKINSFMDKEPPSNPILSKNNFLPHNGLFVRRNNNFGKSPAPNLKQLIENGIMIEQTKLRFDDFMNPEYNNIPIPEEDNAVKISYGISKIPNHSKSNHFLEIALRTSKDTKSEVISKTPLFINYMFVIDVSGSMDGIKLDNVKIAIRNLYNKLNFNDVIGIVKFDNRASTVLKATKCKDLSEERLGELISQLVPDGSTDINLGLSYGFDELNRFKDINYLSQVFLFTDGNPNSGETSWLKIRQNVIERQKGNSKLNIFGFGTDANISELNRLAGSTGGKFLYVTQPDIIQIELQEQFERCQHLAVMNLQIKINIDAEISILHFYGHDLVTDPAHRDTIFQGVDQTRQEIKNKVGIHSLPDIVKDEDGIRLYAPNMAINETYWIVLELALPKNYEENLIGTAEIQYVDLFKRENKCHEIELNDTGLIPSNLVILHSIALWTSEVAFYALEDLYQNEVDTAKSRIEKHIEYLNSINQYLKSEKVKDDIITLKKLVSLSQNLGKPIRMVHDSSASGIASYMIFAMNEFGRSNNGFIQKGYTRPYNT